MFRNVAKRGGQTVTLSLGYEVVMPNSVMRILSKALSQFFNNLSSSAVKFLHLPIYVEVHDFIVKSSLDVCVLH